MIKIKHPPSHYGHSNNIACYSNTVNIQSAWIYPMPLIVSIFTRSPKHWQMKADSLSFTICHLLMVHCARILILLSINKLDHYQPFFYTFYAFSLSQVVMLSVYFLLQCEMYFFFLNISCWPIQVYQHLSHCAGL